jgi:lysophospholipase
VKPNDTQILQFEAGTVAFQQLVPQNQANIRIDSALIPNAFAGRQGFTEENEEFLSLADGALDGGNLPIIPLLVKARGVQAVIVLDVSGDTKDNFVDGSGMLVSSYCPPVSVHPLIREQAEAQRVSLFPGAYKFPQIPQTQAEFAAENITKQPTFFGCDEDQDVPMILYFANGAPPPGQPPITNASTGQLSFPDLSLVQAIMDQAGEIVSRGRPQNGEARDPLFPVCVACALADRERSRLGLKRDHQCDICFDRYCYKPGQQQTSSAAVGSSHAAAALVDADSSTSSSNGLAKYGPIVIGLLGANLLVTAVLLVLGIVLCTRKGVKPTRYTALDS